MLNFKNITLAVIPENFCFDTYKRFFETQNLENTTVNLVHIFEIRNYINEFASYTYPDQETMPKIKEQFIKMLDSFGAELLGKNNKVLSHCLFDTDPKKAMVDFLEDQKSDLAIIPTAGKHGIAGLFHSSFAQHLCQFSKCPILVLK